MIRDEHINAAVAQGILSQEQAARLRDLARGQTREDDAADEPPVHPDDEKFSLIGGFNDIFVTIGVLLLVGALVGIARQTGIAVLVLIIAWGWRSLRRMLLPLIPLGALRASVPPTA